MKKTWNLPVVKMVPLREVEESRAVALVTSGPAWKAVEGLLHLPVTWKAEVGAASLEAWEALLEGLRGEVVYAVGGGLAADAAKYLATRSGLPLVAIPTALSVDAFLTPAAGVRREGCVQYLETRPPGTLLLDLEVIAAAPAWLRAAGITDVLSIATGCRDWQFAQERGRNPPGMEFIPWVHQAAQAILAGALDCAPAAGQGDREGLKTLFDCLAMEVQLCNQVGHSRPEEGSEHYFAYCVENLAGPGLPHGNLVGPGILLAAGWQGLDTHRLEKALRDCHIPLDGIPPDKVAEACRLLPAYCHRHGLPYGIAHELAGTAQVSWLGPGHSPSSR